MNGLLTSLLAADDFVGRHIESWLRGCGRLVLTVAAVPVGRHVDGSRLVCVFDDKLSLATFKSFADWCVIITYENAFGPNTGDHACRIVR